MTENVAALVALCVISQLASKPPRGEPRLLHVRADNAAEAIRVGGNAWQWPGTGRKKWSATVLRLPRLKRGTRHLSAVHGHPAPSPRQASCLPLSRRRAGTITTGPAAGRSGGTPPPPGRRSAVTYRAYLLRRRRRRRFPDGSLAEQK
jgi:hypothetical protein